jgi:hypothetical protein
VATTTQEHEATVLRQVVGWRFDELRRVGYSEESALELAQEAGIDLHVAIDLIRRGCPHETALRILR